MISSFIRKPLILEGITLIIFSILLASCIKKETPDYPFHFRFITEEYKPLNYMENDTLTGLAPEVLREVCTQLGIPFEVSVLPWEEGYNQVLTNDNAVLFSTILNETRKDQFKWAGPIASLDWLFYTAPGNPIVLETPEEAKLVPAIGVLPDYSITQYLVNLGFTNLVYCTDNKDAFDRLLKGQITLFPSDRITAEAALASLGKSIFSVTSVFTIRTDLVYFAFNRQIPDEVVADFQEQIDLMKENGKLEHLYREFMQSNDFPGKLQLYTEQYPPLTFRNTFGEITGYGTDIVYEILRRNKMFEEVKLSHWSIGYDLALHNPNFCLFTMDRTPARDTLFQWVGPLGTNTTWFYTRAGSGITLTSLDDAKKLNSVGTVSSWFNDQYLRQLGFTNLVTDGDPRVQAEKLIQGKIDAFVCTDVTFPDILAGLGYRYDRVVPSYNLMSSDFYIAFSKGTPASTVSQWQSTLDAIRADQTFEAIRRKWFPW